MLKARVTRILLDEENLPLVYLFPYEEAQHRTSTLQVTWTGKVPAVGEFVDIMIEPQ